MGSPTLNTARHTSHLFGWLVFILKFVREYFEFCLRSWIAHVKLIDGSHNIEQLSFNISCLNFVCQMTRATLHGRC